MAKKIAKSGSKSVSKSGSNPAGKSAGKPVSKPVDTSAGGKSVGKKVSAKAGKPAATRAETTAKRTTKAAGGSGKSAVKAVDGTGRGLGGAVRGAAVKGAAGKVLAKVAGKPALGPGKAKSGLASAVSQAVTVAPAASKPSVEPGTQEAKSSKVAGRPGSKWERPSLKRSPAQQAAMTASKGRLEKQREVARAFAVDVARLLSDLRCENVVILDWSKYSSTSDYVVVATGTSDRQMRTCGDEVSKLAETANHGLPRVESDERATWVLCDASDVVTHVFEPNTRAHYDMEGIYADAPRVDWKR